MESSSSSGLLKLLTLALHTYSPTSFSETFVICKEKNPFLLPSGSRYFTLAFLLAPSLIIWPLNFHCTSVSNGCTSRPTHFKVTLEPLFATTMAWTAFILGIVAVVSVKDKRGISKKKICTSGGRG